MKHILIDSDVLLDMLTDRKPFSKDALEIFSLCEQKKIQGYVTPIIIANMYFILRKLFTHDAVTNGLDKLLDVIEVAHTDKTVIRNALKSDFKDFEDALQNFSAVKNGKITTIITRNVKDYKKSTLAIVSPEMYLKEN
jgi:predicted nucleic acid-binding protein